MERGERRGREKEREGGREGGMKGVQHKERGSKGEGKEGGKL